jgi:hypothetical protein
MPRWSAERRARPAGRAAAPEKRDRLSVETTRGVFCGKEGLFVGGVPLLERRRNSSGADEWRPRPATDLNRDLHKHYGVPIEFERKTDGLGAICRALNRGDLIHAQIATLHLQIPEPPVFTKAAQTPDAVIDRVRELRISGLLKQDWDPQKHPRWPAGSPDSVGGQFAPAGAEIGDSASEQDASAEQNAQVIPAQLAIPAPFELPGAIPFPSEILPPPVIPDTHPRDIPRNPYPAEPDCEAEWAEATDYCQKLYDSGRMGKDGIRGQGKFLYQCILGRVSERCGGAPTSRGYET